MTIGLLVLSTVLLGGLVFTFLRLRANVSLLSVERDRAKSLEGSVIELTGRNSELSKYSGIADAEVERERILREAREAAEKLTKEADARAASVMLQAKADSDALLKGAQEKYGQSQTTLNVAQRDAAEIVKTAERRASEIMKAAEERASEIVQAAEARASLTLSSAETSASDLVRNAESRASQIVHTANEEAERTAGDALVALRDVDKLKQTAAALKNVVDGYGDEYIVPVQTVLDELADKFGFADPAQKLKELRTQVRQMTKDKSGARCDYVEQNRRDTAIAFVLDAFNGKADTILADVKEDNVGTLQQKLKDAFVLVNKNGEAFRNARITDDYLQLRLEELRWAAAVVELRERDKEEQRALREKIRDEERAQREYERAMKEAAKEEDVVKKAMEKAQKEMEKASAADKAKYEAQLSELEAKLREAEAKNQKALSMAQLTKAGFVYVISNVGSFGDDVFKIGMTRRLEPLDRVKELGDASVPFEFDVHALIKTEDAPALEYELHKRFVRSQVNKVNPRKEFFRVQLEEIRRVVEDIGITPQWTMTAAAKSYKETVAIEKAMKEKKFDEGNWLREQLRPPSSFVFDDEENAESEDGGAGNDATPKRKNRSKAPTKVDA